MTKPPAPELGNRDLPHVKKHESTESLRPLRSYASQTPYPRTRVYTPHSSMLKAHTCWCIHSHIYHLCVASVQRTPAQPTPWLPFLGEES